MPITPLASTPAALPIATANTGAGSSSSSGAGFGDALHDLLSGVEATSADANSAVAKAIDGTGDVHEAVIALQRADMTMQLTVQIRNKLVQAYEDVMRMAI